jgi:hypothetical protein
MHDPLVILGVSVPYSEHRRWRTRPDERLGHYTRPADGPEHRAFLAGYRAQPLPEHPPDLPRWEVHWLEVWHRRGVKWREVEQELERVAQTKAGQRAARRSEAPAEKESSDFRRGQEAYRRGVPISAAPSSPYWFGGTRAWRRGWRAAQQEAYEASIRREEQKT